MLDMPDATTTEPPETAFDLRKEAEAAGITETLRELDQQLIGLKPVKSRVRQIASLLLIEPVGTPNTGDPETAATEIDA